LRLAAAGNRVLYIENTGVRTPGLRDAGRVVARLNRWARSRASNGLREIAPNLYISSPVVLPPFGSGLQRDLNRRFFLSGIIGTVKRLQMRDPLIWTYLPSDTVLDIIRLIRSERSVVVYYSLADFPYLAEAKARMEQSERKLLESCDLVFANCTKLAYRFSRWNQNVHVFPPGVNLSAFPPLENKMTAGLDPLTLLGITRPRIGYSGGLHRFIDYDLICAMAEARPDWSWIMLGAPQVDLKRLKRFRNVYLLGQQQHEALVHYLSALDVCIVPYLNTPEMSTVVPTKINEYLAVGKPVVSTDLPTVYEFNEEYRVLLTSPPEPKQFLEAIEQAVAFPGSDSDKRRRREVAALADWQVRLESMSGLIELQMAERARPVEARVPVLD